jgi:hypothetical protein
VTQVFVANHFWQISMSLDSVPGPDSPEEE